MAKYVLFVITFRITTDDKEHQDAVYVEVRNARGTSVFGGDGSALVPSMGVDNEPGDQNNYYWPSDGPGKRPHSFNLFLSPQIPEEELAGSQIEITSSNKNPGEAEGHHDDFESWIADVDIVGYLEDNRHKTILLNGSPSQNLNWQNGENGKSFTFALSV